jgi:signal transduction histidine kinase
LETVGTLAGGVAHDFNNLLMGIQGNTSLLLLDTDINHPHYERLKNIENNVQEGADLTNQLLGFARGGKYKVRPADLNEIIEKNAEMFGRTRKEMTIHSEYQESIWTVEVDIGQIEQVLLNVFVNAWQAMPAGGDLFIQTDNVILDESYSKVFRLEPGRYVKISITDTGVGMDDATVSRVFEPFFTTKGMGRGTGLGLASAYGIIRGHGGVIYVHSEKGRGTTFEIYLPAVDRKTADG